MGGAEVLYVNLAAALRRHGAETEVVFVGRARSLAERLRAADLPFHELGFPRGRDLLLHPRRFAAVATRTGRDGVLLPECGFIGAALRVGGYAGPIVGVEHGGGALRPGSTGIRRTLELAARVGGAWADDADIAVSEFMLEHLRRNPHARRIGRIYNAIDTDSLVPFPDGATPSVGPVAVGFAARLIPGKGADRAIRAIAQAVTEVPMELRIAGEGPERARLESLAVELGVKQIVRFPGLVADIRELWRDCEVAVFPSDQFVESFGLSALEAMACGRPVVATRNGGLPEVVDDGRTGMIVERGDVGALASALIRYAVDPELRISHGSSARARAVEMFGIERCARAYLELFDVVARARARH